MEYGEGGCISNKAESTDTRPLRQSQVLGLLQKPARGHLSREAREVTWFMKYLPCKYEDLSFIPSYLP